jgi:hypothetical protein
MSGAYPRSGQDMLRVAFPHKTDGVGGHVVTATSALGGAALLGLRIVCDPAMLYNGHLAQSDPHLGSRLLLGCDDGDGGDGPAAGEAGGETCADGAEDGSWFRVASLREASLHAEVRVATWAELALRVEERAALLSSAPPHGAGVRPPSHPPVVFTLSPAFATAAAADAADAADADAATARKSPQPGTLAAGWFLSACSPERAALWPAAAALLRGRYHRRGTSAGFTSPEATAAPLCAFLRCAPTPTPTPTPTPYPYSYPYP